MFTGGGATVVSEGTTGDVGTCSAAVAAAATFASAAAALAAFWGDAAPICGDVVLAAVDGISSGYIFLKIGVISSKLRSVSAARSP